MTRNRFSLVLVAALALGLFPHAPAVAAQAKPTVSTHAWYWTDQRQQKVTDPDGADVATLELPNPFCPGPGGGLGAPEQTCRAGRLPIEVRGGNYEEPNKISAVMFDLFAVPLGSKVHKFTVTFREATDEQSEPLNPEGKRLQACIVDEFFGEGEARPSGAAPTHACRNNDPKARRKEVKGSEDEFEWTFNLTEFAQTWVEGAPVAAVMLYPVEPEEGSPADQVNWRIVLDGPVENDGKSIRAKIVYTPAEPEDDLFGDDDFTGSGSFGDDFTTTPGDFGTDTSPLDVGAGNVPEAETEAEEAEPVETASEEPASASGPPVTTVETPWYVWLALLAGVIAFSMVRSVVLDGKAGIRADGVLAQIRRLNTERRGAPAEAALGEGPAGPFAPLLGAGAALGRGAAALGRRAGALVSKLPVGRKKG